MFFSEVEGHMQKLSSFGRGKKLGLKSHLRGPSTQPFNFKLLLVFHPGCFDHFQLLVSCDQFRGTSAGIHKVNLVDEI